MYMIRLFYTLAYFNIARVWCFPLNAIYIIIITPCVHEFKNKKYIDLSYVLGIIYSVFLQLPDKKNNWWSRVHYLSLITISSSYFYIILIRIHLYLKSPSGKSGIIILYSMNTPRYIESISRRILILHQAIFFMRCYLIDPYAIQYFRPNQISLLHLLSLNETITWL